MNRRLASAIFLASALYLPVESASALGLGKLTVKSALNQPLLAEIPVRKMGSLTEEEVIARLASNDEFERFGVDRTFYHSQLRFRVKKDRDGTAKLVITTRKPIKEPFIDFVLETRTPNGRLIRNYTVLLDLPHLVKQKSPAARQVRQQVQTQAPATSGQRSHSQVSSPSTAVAGDGTYKVQSGDSLWRIAKNNRQGDASINETMQALYELNPEAFTDGDRNKLKAGAVLRLPQGSDAGIQVGSTEATIDSVPDKPQIEAVETEEIVEEVAEEPEDTGYLTLSSADEAATESDEAGVAEDGEESGVVVETGELEDDYVDEESEDIGEIDDEPYQPPQVDDVTEETLQDDTAGIELEAEDAVEVEEAAEAELAEEPAKDSALMSIILGVIGAIVLFALAFFFLRRKSDDAAADEKPAIVPLGQRGEEQQEIEEEQDFEDEVEEPEEGAEVAAETDAASEADIYIAYGRFDQAADVLTRALDADPDNEEVRLKLAEVYVDGKMKDEYLALLSLAEDAGNDALVIKMKSLLDSNEDTSIWVSTEEIEEEEESLDLDIGKLSTDTDDTYTQAAAEKAAEQAAEEALQELEEEVDIGSVDEVSVDLEADEAEVSEELPSSDDFTVEGLSDTESEHSDLEQDEPLLEDFDLESSTEEGSSLDNALATTAEDEPAAAPEPEEPDFSDEEEVATKLELASAYIDMGDYDGARDILEEVLEEGNEAQKKEAQELLEQVD